MKKLIGSLILAFGLIGSSAPALAIDASAQLEALAKKMIRVIEEKKEALKSDPKIAEDLVREYLLPVIDKETFAEKTLGSELWQSLTQAQKNQFMDGYINQVINKYAKGLSLYDGQAFEFEQTEIHKKSGNARVKSSMKQSGAEPLAIYYYLSPHGESWKINNIIVAGTNMRDSYKQQFLPRINEIGFDKFLIELNQNTKS